VLATNEPGLGGFNIILFDDAGGTGDATGQMTYEHVQPAVGKQLGRNDRSGYGAGDACPIAHCTDWHE